ncbi:MAG: DUF5615 family PIN-like protein [Candidatus Nanopelagicales bacterium]|nr:DUF5615 family PIN-like protein [Candidatus Nanopelagicales bacterium]MDZ4248878.1 DUF5615 family PIN-like protein [Candidatus Nanopelagicales bacterium]MDZ7578854.1 DUF5615 family PIN-like protein [Candidatus Nanopelagicales bacterium]
MSPQLFLLDQCVSADVAHCLRRVGHSCETAATVGLSDAQDDLLVVAADDMGAILITHDEEMARKRAKRPIGRVIYLGCREWEAGRVLLAELEPVLEVISRYEDVTILLDRSGFRVEHGWRKWDDGDLG